MIAGKKVRCSVLLCVYANDIAARVREAVESVLRQTVPSDNIVIVIDGPIERKLHDEIGRLSSINSAITVVRLEHNMGVGAASNEGLRYCKHDLVAKMDADDVAVLERFEKQLARFAQDPELVLLGGQLAEFSETVKNVVSYRRVPLGGRDIMQFAKLRSPFNNQTVMYKKSVVLKLGGYPQLNRAEDYYLFAKIMASGHKVANLSDVLVYFRLDRDALKRRKTWRHTKEVIKARYEIRKLGVVSTWGLLRAAAGQLVLFLMPAFVTDLVYRVLRKCG